MSDVVCLLVGNLYKLQVVVWLHHVRSKQLGNARVLHGSSLDDQMLQLHLDTRKEIPGHQLVC